MHGVGERPGRPLRLRAGDHAGGDGHQEAAQEEGRLDAGRGGGVGGQEVGHQEGLGSGQ